MTPAVRSTRRARLARLLRSSAFARGAREVSPGATGVAIWGLITGITMVKAGLTVPQALGMTVFVYSGTSQLATLPMLVAGAPFWLVMGTAVLVSLRFVVYSAAVAVDFGKLGPRHRLLVGYLTIDAGLALYQARRAAMPRFAQRYAYFMGSNLLVWACWQVSSIAGIFVAAWLPGSAGSLSYLGSLAVGALVVPLLRSAPTLGCGLAAAAVAVALAHLPYKLGLFAGVIAGTAVAVAMSRRAGVEAAAR